MTLNMPMQEFFRMIWTRAPNCTRYIVALELIEIIREQNPEEFASQFIIEEPSSCHEDYRFVTTIASWKRKQECLARLKAAENLEQAPKNLSISAINTKKSRTPKPKSKPQDEIYNAFMKGLF